jgi:hypothetical protein
LQFIGYDSDYSQLSGDGLEMMLLDQKYQVIQFWNRTVRTNPFKRVVDMNINYTSFFAVSRNTKEIVATGSSLGYVYNKT